MAGYTFENICLKHANLILTTLGLANTHCRISSWQYTPKKGSKENGAQIDLLFDRADDCITICEIKYSNTAYKLDKSNAKNILNKIDTFEKITQTKKQIFCALITTHGTKPSIWHDDIINQDISLEDLMMEE